MMPELFAKTGGMGSDGLLHHLEAFDPPPGERPGDGTALSSGCDGFQVDAGLAAQLLDDPLADDGQRLASELGIESSDISGRLAAEASQLGLAGTANAPDVP
ncbi:hypothetical protein AB4Z40_33235 [Bosea sp. 2YAB26]|jgi:hypothetical protein|uniref:hypothetical protein n=1 Tax=Bosea sp. 2YAB26 TaxID=3237478 RepID=UPI003F8F1FD2